MSSPLYSVPANHPLMSMTPTRINDWAEWMELWRSTTQFEQLMGLLHCGFDVTPASTNEELPRFGSEQYEAGQVERICFYLQLADHSHFGPDWFMSEREEVSREAIHRRPQDHPGKMRYRLAHKAFAVLSEHVFKNGDDPSLWEIVTAEEALEHLLWFFRREADGNYLLNLPWPVEQRQAHYYERARQFAFLLCRRGWEFELAFGVACERLKRVRPQLLEVLLGLGKLDVLVEEHKTYQLDGACWAKLEELAMRPRYLPSPEDIDGDCTRRPESLEEALAHGSQVARVLHTLRALRRWEEQFAERRKLAKQQRQLATRQQELKGSS